MNLTDALLWANANNAVFRFNNNDQHKDSKQSFRCTVVGHKEEDRIIAIQAIGDDTPESLEAVMASTITECRDEFERTRPVNRSFKIVS